MSQKSISVGGQAVIEGVMMRSPTYYATAVRTPLFAKCEEPLSW